MKVLVVGGVAGGASAAARIRRLDSHAEIIIFERGEHVSFSNCCLPYYIGGAVENSEDLIMMTPESFKARYDIDVRVGNEVTKILREEKCILVKDLETNTEYRENYDKLILATGTRPVCPESIRGVSNENVFLVRNVADIRRLEHYMTKTEAQNVAVIGGGFIGIEMAENLRIKGKTVSIIEGSTQILAPYDEDMVQILHKELIDHGVRLHLSSVVTEIVEDRVKAEKNGKPFEVPAEVVVLSIGSVPESSLAHEAGLAIGDSGGIKVNHNYQTDDPDIYAVGDAVEAFSRLERHYGRFMQAGPAQRQARAAADHICGMYHNNKGYIATSCLRVFGKNAACTGMNEAEAIRANIPYDIAYVLPFDKVNIMPESHYMAFKLLFEVPTGQILGAQAIGAGNVTRRIDVIASIITMQGTLEDLKEIELCYSPVYGTAKDVINMAALVGLNLLYNRYKQIPVSQARGLVESGAYVVDVREKDEYERGHLKNAVNIPLTQFKQRIGEIPKDIPVYLYCRTSQRSYYALCELFGNGYKNITNISGSFLGICLYEYFHDQDEKRDPIVTAYNFN